MRVTAIRPAGRADVFNLEVEDTHDFAVGSGIIVHNCYDELRYVCMANPISPRPAQRRRVMVWDPLNQDPLHQRGAAPAEDFYRRVM